MKNLRTITEEIEKEYFNMGINTFFDLNEGGHFNQVETRVNKAISWHLNN